MKNAAVHVRQERCPSSQTYGNGTGGCAAHAFFAPPPSAIQRHHAKKVVVVVVVVAH